MLMLALGMDDPRHGTVEVEYSGAEPQAIKASNLTPGTFAYALQGNMLMSGSIRDTVMLSDRPGAEGLPGNASKRRGQIAEPTDRKSQSMTKG